MELVFTFDYDRKEVFPGKTQSSNFLDIGILNRPNATWERKTISMKFESTTYNSFSSSASKMVRKLLKRIAL